MRISKAGKCKGGSAECGWYPALALRTPCIRSMATHYRRVQARKRGHKRNSEFLIRNEKERGLFAARFSTPRSEICTPPSKGFTLIELAVVIAILGIMIALVAPRLGELGEANLKRSARHLTGMIRFLHDEAQAKKTEYRLTFDIPGGNYWAETWVDTSENSAGPGDKAPFRTRELKRIQSAIAGEGSLSGETKFRDVVVASHPDDPYILFTPDGWVEKTFIYLRDGNDRDFTLIIKPLTAATELHEGYLEER